MEILRAFKCFALVLISVAFLLSVGYSTLWTGTFDAISTAGESLEVYETVRNSRTCVECASMCVDKRIASAIPICQAIRYNPTNRTCNFYRKGSVQMPAPGIEVFLFRVFDVFHTISVSGKTFSIYLSSETKTYREARTHCKKLEGYLLQFDSLEEYDAIKIVAVEQAGESYVGANDIKKESRWVTDREGTLLDKTIWLWHGSEGSISRTDENCAVISYDYMKIKDRSCFYKQTFWCERDL